MNMFIKLIVSIVLLLSFALSFSYIVYVISTPLHEIGHWVMMDLDPELIPIRISFFDNGSIGRTYYVRMCSEIEMEQKSMWQEFICYSINFICICIGLFLTLPRIVKSLMEWAFSDRYQKTLNTGNMEIW